MKQQRDLDLIRDLLLDLEGVEEVDLSDYEQEQIYYHMYLIQDAELAVGDVIWGRDGQGMPAPTSAMLQWLTWEGQEFLANARNPRAWQSVTGDIAMTGLEVSFSVVKSLLTAYMKQEFGLS